MTGIFIPPNTHRLRRPKHFGAMRSLSGRFLFKTRVSATASVFAAVLLTSACGGGGAPGSTPAGLTPPPQTIGSVSFSWERPALNIDGTQFANLTGYTIYYGTSPSTITNQITNISEASTSHVINNLPSGTYYIKMTAHNSLGEVSPFSNVIIRDTQ